MPYLLFLPALLVVAAISLYPTLYGIWLSFTKWFLLSSPRPVFDGLNGYVTLVQDPQFWSSLGRTVIWTLGTVLIEYLVGMPIALLLNRRNRLNSILTGLMLLPWVTPTVVVAYTWGWLFDSSFGIIHKILQFAGLAGQASVLTNPNNALPALTIISGWKGTPFMVVALLAALKNIPDDLYEAAAVDGASVLARFRYITLPLIAGVGAVMCLILGIWAFYSFDIVWIITKGGPVNATQILGVYLFRTFFERLFVSYASNIAVVMLVLLLIVATFYVRLTLREE